MIPRPLRYWSTADLRDELARLNRTQDKNANDLTQWADVLTEIRARQEEAK